MVKLRCQLWTPPPRSTHSCRLSPRGRWAEDLPGARNSQKSLVGTGAGKGQVSGHHHLQRCREEAMGEKRVDEQGDRAEEEGTKVLDGCSSGDPREGRPSPRGRHQAEGFADAGQGPTGVGLLHSQGHWGREGPIGDHLRAADAGPQLGDSSSAGGTRRHSRLRAPAPREGS